MAVHHTTTTLARLIETETGAHILVMSPQARRCAVSRSVHATLYETHRRELSVQRGEHQASCGVRFAAASLMEPERGRCRGRAG